MWLTLTSILFHTKYSVLISRLFGISYIDWCNLRAIFDQPVQLFNRFFDNLPPVFDEQNCQVSINSIVSKSFWTNDITYGLVLIKLIIEKSRIIHHLKSDWTYQLFSPNKISNVILSSFIQLTSCLFKDRLLRVNLHKNVFKWRRTCITFTLLGGVLETCKWRSTKRWRLLITYPDFARITCLFAFTCINCIR